MVKKKQKQVKKKVKKVARQKPKKVVKKKPATTTEPKKEDFGSDSVMKDLDETTKMMEQQVTV